MMDGGKRFGGKMHLFVFAVGILLTVCFQCFFAYTGMRQKKQEASHMLEIYGVRTESMLNRLFHKTDVLESVIITNQGELDPDTFSNLAKTLLEGNGIRALQCLPQGIVTFCYPMESNEGAIGENIFENPGRKDDAALAVKTKNLVLSGPYNLTQGGFGLVARNPVFLTDSEGEESFWGFTVVVLNLPDALEPLALSELKTTGYVYRLFCVVNGEDVIVDQTAVQEGSREEKILGKFAGEAGKDYVEVSIEVPNHEWQLMVTPTDGWVNKGLLGFTGFVGVCFTLLLTIIICLLERQEKQMEQFATTDELTGLFNRRRLKEYMDIRCRDHKVKFVLFYLDLNKFKGINDTLGHSCGDAVLIEAGRRIKKAIGSDGSVYRVGGDEFIALKELLETERGCREQEERIRDELGKPFDYCGKALTITAGIGCSKFPEEGNTLDELIKKADQRMYADKMKR